MKEQLPAPQFDASQYARPNQDWICGKAAKGQCCRIGPDPSGRCRATFECRPVLELKEGETKGRYRCTRTAEFGGACETGPLPDGTCCRAITKCQPVRSLRAKRKVFTRVVVMLTVAVLLVSLSGPFRSQFINPGRLSAQHSTEAFARMHRGAGGNGQDCAACHGAAGAGPARWLGSAAGADPALLEFHKLLATTNTGLTAIDASCQTCHQRHNFHEPNVVRDHSCSACHREHQGMVMQRPEDANCASCHADGQVMQASFQRGKELPAAAFDYRPDLGWTMFKAPRPEQGYTKVIHTFATDHPEFQVLAEKLRDPDTLKFNHQLHLGSPNIPSVNGKKLDCATCHKPDATGLYYQPVSYEQNCKVCHSLQFDEKNPELSIPHGNAEFARAFLRSLPAQYAEYGRNKKGLTTQVELDAFVKLQMAGLRKQALAGENLEQQVFFSDAHNGPMEKTGDGEQPARARYPGCAYCHEVKATGADAAPDIVPPVQMTRWLIRGQFNHAKHINMACAKCHDVERSRETADVLLPSKSSCVECHSPKGGVASGCATCHSYHAPGGVIGSLSAKD
ncbi:MAG: hypothetical protein JWR19_3000 [Pedosphaera sp.]|nr:hypothetical protein [Pedosphaera sp.]